MKTIVRLRRLFAWIGLVALLPLALSAAEITPPVVIQTDEVRFPPSLSNSTITTGKVLVLISVTAEGTLSDLLVAAYDHEAFVPEVEAALRQWRFEPGKIDGQPAPMRVLLQFEIGARKRVVALDANTTFAAAAIRALDGWKFSPPRSKSRPVIVHFQQDFVFASEE